MAEIVAGRVYRSTATSIQTYWFSNTVTIFRLGLSTATFLRSLNEVGRSAGLQQAEEQLAPRTALSPLRPQGFQLVGTEAVTAVQKRGWQCG
jgi:hypothetical protein